MVFLVPFDGSSAAEAALRRAVEHGRALQREVLAVSFVPTGSSVAQRRTWVEHDRRAGTRNGTPGVATHDRRNNRRHGTGLRGS